MGIRFNGCMRTAFAVVSAPTFMPAKKAVASATPNNSAAKSPKGGALALLRMRSWATGSCLNFKLAGLFKAMLYILKRFPFY